MPRKLNPREIDDLVKRYLAGESYCPMARKAGVAPDTLRTVLVSRGITIRRSTGNQTNVLVIAGIDPADTARRYLAGETRLSIAQGYGVTDKVIGRILLQHHVPLRDMVAARRLIFPEVAALDLPATVAAYRAGKSILELSLITGVSRKTITDKLERRGIQIRTLDSPDERMLHEALLARGVESEPQKWVRPYHIDLALSESGIAVEVQWGGMNPGHGCTRRKRTEYLLDRGWCMIFVCQRKPLRPSFSADPVANKLMALVKRAGRNKALAGQYGVIWSDGELAPRPRGYLDSRPYVFDPRGRAHQTTNKRSR